jgi:hypothetical protein
MGSIATALIRSTNADGEGEIGFVPEAVHAWIETMLDAMIGEYGTDAGEAVKDLCERFHGLVVKRADCIAGERRQQWVQRELARDEERARLESALAQLEKGRT